MTSKQDQALVIRAQAGDSTAFDALVLKHESQLINAIRGYTNERADAYDIAQETWIKCWQSVGSFRGESAFFSWLYRIAINTAKSHIKQEARRATVTLSNDDGEELDLDMLVHGSLDTPENLMIADDISKALALAINALPKEQHAALALFERGDLGYEAIASALHIPAGTVRSRIFRARKAIDKRLSPLLEN